MKMSFVKYYDYRIAIKDDNTIIQPTLEAKARGDDDEFLPVNMVDIESREDDLLDVDNVDRRMYNELISLTHDKDGNPKSLIEAQESILSFVKQNGNIGSSVITSREIEKIQLNPVETRIVDKQVENYATDVTYVKEITHFSRREPSINKQNSFLAHPDCLFYNGDPYAKGTVFSDIRDLKLLVDQYNSSAKIDTHLMNTHLLECNVAEILEYNENDELVLTGFFDTIIGLAYWQLKNDIATNMNIKQCSHCGKYFTAKNPKAKYCQNKRDYSGNSQCARAARNKVSNSRRKVRNEAKKGTPLETLLATIKDLDNEIIENEYKKVVRK